MIIVMRSDYPDLFYSLLLLFVLGFVLVIIQRPMKEGFESPQRCGVGNPCSGFLKCINGFCAETQRLEIKENDPVPMLDIGSPAPYF